MLTEQSPYQDMSRILHRCVEIPVAKLMNERVIRARLKGESHIFYRTKAPGSGHPVLIVRNVNIRVFTPMLILDGREGEGYASRNSQGGVFVLESHAIRRYFNRHEKIPVEHLSEVEPDLLKEVVHRILADGDKISPSINDTDGYGEAYYDDGIFLCLSDGPNCRMYSYVMNSQTFPDQRLRSLRSEKKQNERCEELTDAKKALKEGRYWKYRETRGWK